MHLLLLTSPGHLAGQLFQVVPQRDVQAAQQWQERQVNCLARATKEKALPPRAGTPAFLHTRSQQRIGSELHAEADYFGRFLVRACT